MQAVSQKHLSIILNTWLSFKKHLETVISEISRIIGLIRKLQTLSPKTALKTLYKTFGCLQPDYGHFFIIKLAMYRIIRN